MNRRNLLKLVVAAILVAAAAGAYVSPLRQQLTLANVRSTAALVSTLWYGPLVYVAAFSVATTLLLPASIFVVSAGVIWGWKLGFLYALVGGIVASIVSFMTARFLGEGAIERLGSTATSLAERLRSAGFKVLLVARLLVPFAIVNYGAGVARVRLRDFVASTAIGMAPATFVFVYSADSLVNGTLTSGDAAKRVLGLAALLVTLVLLPSLFKKRAARILEEG